MADLIYLDGNSTTPLDPRVLDEMLPFLQEQYGNANSNHPFGAIASEAVKNARQQVCHLINAQTNELVFTSGATEAINLAIKGVAEAYAHKGRKIVTVSTEHSAVLDVCKVLEAKGFEVEYLPVQANGLVDTSTLEKAVGSDTILVCVMMVNNETGVIQPIKRLAEIAHEAGAFFMSDATQAVGKMPVDVDELGIDLLAMSGHKLYGPKGVGALFTRRRRPWKVKLASQIHGGGHERKMRSGTLNVPGIVGLGKACELARREMASNAEKIRPVRDAIEASLLELQGSFVNGDRQKRLYNTLNICFPGIDSDALIVGLADAGGDVQPIMLSNGSACTSTSIEPSHVLTAMGLSEEEAFGSIRISLTKELADVSVVTARIQEVRECLSALSG